MVLARDEGDDMRWPFPILVPRGCRPMRVNSRRLQPSGEDPLGRRCTESPTWKSGPKPSNGQHVSRKLSIFEHSVRLTCNIVSIDSRYVL